MQNNTIYIAGLYLRLSKDDERSGESISIGTQRAILTDFCVSNQYTIYKEYIDDGYSGLNFDRPGFRALLEDVERGVINMVITKDLSRLGRDYIMTGYYSEIFFQSKGVRYIALADDVDSLKGHNEIAPFKNILNDMYARDISKKVKNAKGQRAKQGLFIGSQAPFGYCTNSDNKNQLVVDPEAAEVVRTIFNLAASGLGSVAIAKELKMRGVVTPSVYKRQRGDTRFARFADVAEHDLCAWRPATIGKMLNNSVYTGELVSLKTETINCKTKQRITVPKERQIVTPNAHEAIIDAALFEKVKQIRADHRCAANDKRENLFRGKLFCECCGHPLALSKKILKDRTADMYFCMNHYRRPASCPKTHRIYHESLYPYVLQQIRIFAKSMKRKKINSPIKAFSSLEELTSEVLEEVIERIEIGHVTRKSKPGSVIQIYWKLR